MTSFVIILSFEVSDRAGYDVILCLIILAGFCCYCFVFWGSIFASLVYCYVVFDPIDRLLSLYVVIPGSYSCTFVGTHLPS